MPARNHNQGLIHEGHIFSSIFIFLKVHENIQLNHYSSCLKLGYLRSKARSLGQISEKVSTRQSPNVFHIILEYNFLVAGITKLVQAFVYKIPVWQGISIQQINLLKTLWYNDILLLRNFSIISQLFKLCIKIILSILII